MKVPTGGGTPTALASGQNNTNQIAVDATMVYWTTIGRSFTSYADGTVMKIPTGGGTPTTLASGQQYASRIVVDATSVYWTNAGMILASSTNGTVMELTPK